MCPTALRRIFGVRLILLVLLQSQVTHPAISLANLCCSMGLVAALAALT